MDKIAVLGEAFEEGKRLFEEIINAEAMEQFNTEAIFGSHSNSQADTSNEIASGDNLAYMKYLIMDRNMAGKFKLIYVDPPFYSKSNYQASIRINSETLGSSSLIKVGAYGDYSNKGFASYITMLTARIMMMKELLADDGLIWVHLDWHTVHYVKLIMDEIFGERNFVNEIIWNYKSGGSSKKSFAKKHDTLLLYSKSSDYSFNPLKEKSYNRGYKPYRFKGVEEFSDEKGWYTVVNMKDVWQIDMVGRTSQERTGYETQKPEKLMERIITSCSKEGDLCGDFFAGSGTFGAVCEKLGRHWVMCDEGKVAISDQVCRTAKMGASFNVKESCASTKQHVTVKAECVYGDAGVTARLINYIPDSEHIISSNADEVNKYLASDELSLIKFWSVDWTHNGVHKSEQISFDGHENIINEKCININKSNNQIGDGVSVFGYDIFGNKFIIE